jgi:hypothetical protein
MRKITVTQMCVAVTLLGFTVNAASQTTGSTQSSVSAAGDSVKQGDTIVWLSDKSIQLVESDAKSTAGVVSTASTDSAAVAQAIQVAASAAVNSAAAPATVPNAPVTAVAALKAAVFALTTADANAKTAGVSVGTIYPISNTTVALAAKDLQSAEQDSLTAANSASSAVTAQAAAESAVAAAKPGSSVAQKNASAAPVEAAKSLDQAAAFKAYFAVVTSAYELIVSASVKTSSVAIQKASTVCFPARSRFYVTSIAPATKNTQGGAAGGSTSGATTGTVQNASSAPSTVTTSNTQLVEGLFTTSADLLHPLHKNATNAGLVQPGIQSEGAVCGTEAPVKPQLDKTYSFTTDELNKGDFRRFGFTWGGMVIPFKYYFSDKSIKTNSSVVGFAGWEGWFPGVSLATVAALGGGAASTTSPGSSSTNGSAPNTTTTSPVTAVTYTMAVGVVATFGGKVKAGLMVGRDYQGNASQFQYENKTWLAASIGAGF